MSFDDADIELRVGSPPAPGDLVILEAFLNTWSGELAIEDFDTVRSADAWLRHANLWTDAKKVTEEQLLEVRKFRDALRAWISHGDDATLTDMIAGIPFQAVLSSEGDFKFHPEGNGIQQTLGRFAAIISHSQQEGSWDRFKCCELPTCGWAYYDSTRSRTKRWCSMKTCGSRHKAREYYKRKRLSIAPD